MRDSKFAFEMSGIGSVLGSRLLSVPRYQRSYAWGSNERDEEVAEFWGDLHSAFAQEGAEYFLGTIVLSKDRNQERLAIIDGQQRLATTAILLAAIRDTFRERDDEDRGATIQGKFLATKDLRSNADVPQIILNVDDDAFFGKRVIEGLSASPQTNSEKLISEAYSFLKKNITVTADDSVGNWADKLSDWVEFLQERTQVIVVEVPTESDAFLIFETLNDRGADLTIADLLKNYLFGQAGDRIGTVQQSWITALANLDVSTEGGQRFTDFLRHFWSSKYGATRERDLYGRIKEQISSGKNAVDFTAELAEAARLYDAILHSDHEFWSNFETEVRKNVAILQILGLEQNRPLLLAAMQHLAPRDLEEMLRCLVSWSMRGIVIGRIGGGTAERVYCDAAVGIRAGTFKNTGEVRAALAAIIGADEEFKARFATARITRGRLARYVLAALERTASGKTEPEMVPNENEQEVNLEHVLPKNPTPSDWAQFGDEEARAYLYRVGNMVLLSRGPNGRIGNKPFATKKPVLEKSDLLLTRQAGAEEDWTPAIIDARQKKLADLAVKTWAR